MKRAFLLLLASFAVTIAVNAQPGGGFQRQTPEQQTAAIHQKLDSAFQLGAEKIAPLDTALTILFKVQNDRMREIMTGGGERPDRETMMAERKKYTDARDEMIKSVITAEQFTIWKEKIEPSMRPARPQGMGGGGNRNQNK